MDPSIQSQILCVHTLGAIYGFKFAHNVLTSGRQHKDHNVVHLQNIHIPTSLQVFQVIREFDTVESASHFHNDPYALAHQAEQISGPVIPKEVNPLPFKVSEDTKIYEVRNHPVITPLSKTQVKIDMILVLWRKGKFVHKVYMSGVTGAANISMKKMRLICKAIQKL